MSFHSPVYEPSPASSQILIPSPTGSQSSSFPFYFTELQADLHDLRGRRDSTPSESIVRRRRSSSTSSAAAVRRQLVFGTDQPPRRRRYDSDPSAPPATPDELDYIEGLSLGGSAVCIGAPNSPTDPPPPYEYKDSNPRLSQYDGVLDCWMEAVQQQAYNPAFLCNALESRQQQLKERQLMVQQTMKDALGEYVSQQCCYGSRAAKKMRTKSITEYFDHHYVVETFYQERYAKRHEEPYTDGQVIDGKENGPPPRFWDIPVPQPEPFKKDEVHIEVPHTASVKECTHCCGVGSKQCKECRGMGDIRCADCHGHGQLSHTSGDMRLCSSCSGGKKMCGVCKGLRKVSCQACKGNGKVKHYIRLTVNWRLQRDEKVFEESGVLPTRCISEAHGENVFLDENDFVYPLTNFPREEINESSRKLLTYHQEKLKHALIVRQRHYIRQVPVREVEAEYKKKRFSYIVYGDENRVHAPEYPQKCFGACVIL